MTQHAAALVYPCGDPPAPGDAHEIAPGVHWLRMPLPCALNHINLWALDDGERLGHRRHRPADERDRARLAHSCSRGRALGGAPADARVRHPHAPRPHRHGRLDDAQVRLPPVDDAARVPDLPRAGRRHRARSARRRRSTSTAAPAGTTTRIETYRARFGGFGKLMHALPDSYRRLHDGESVRIGAHDWRVVVGSGHSPEHACLYCPDLKLIDLGRPGAAEDLVQRLGVPDRARRRPAGDWLASLARSSARCRTTCWCCRRTTSRSAACTRASTTWRSGQRRALERLARDAARAAAARWTCSARCSLARSARNRVLGLATGESQANINHLLQLGEAVVDRVDDGVAWYRLTSA